MHLTIGEYAVKVGQVQGRRAGERNRLLQESGRARRTATQSGRIAQALRPLGSRGTQATLRAYGSETRPRIPDGELTTFKPLMVLTTEDRVPTQCC
jgi:hypothetical protein